MNEWKDGGKKQFSIDVVYCNLIGLIEPNLLEIPGVFKSGIDSIC